MALRIGRGSNHRMLSLPQIDPVALTLSVALRLMSQRDESNGSATKDSTSEPGSDRVNRGMSHKHRFYQHPPGIKVGHTGGPSSRVLRTFDPVATGFNRGGTQLSFLLSP